MLRAVITGAREAKLVETTVPSPKEHWALVRVTVAPMCTEYKQWLAGTPGEYLGHEAVGEVVETAQPGRVRVGDRVVVQPLYACGSCPVCVQGEHIHCEEGPTPAAFTGSREGSATMAEYLLKPDWLLSRIPPDVSDEDAALALCTLGPSFGAFQRIELRAHETVLITGLGPVGLGAVANAVFRGARVLAVESNPFRAERARELGAEQVFNPSDPETPARLRAFNPPIDCAVDCSGSPAAHRLLIDSVRRKGRIAFVGECSQDTVIRISPDLIRKGLTLIGSWHYNLAEFPRLLQVIRRLSNRDLLVSHRFPLTEIQTAFETLAGQETAKVLLTTR